MSDENKRTIQLLNEDLYGEHDAIVYYLTHAWTVARQYGSQILEIANDEMRHFKWLGHTISQLGGTPDLAVPPMTPASDLASALEKDVQAEIHAIDQYRQHADEARSPGNQNSHEVLPQSSTVRTSPGDQGRANARKYSMVASRPSWRDTLGSQPKSVRAF